MKTLIILIIFLSTNVFAKNEADWVNETCEGKIEYRLFDRTRVDCLTNTHAIEYDWQHKWAEAIGQSLYYSAVTGKQAGIRLICKNKNCNKYKTRIEKVLSTYQLDIRIELINEFDK